MSKNLLGVISVSAALLAAPLAASAADLRMPLKAPMPVPVVSWTGCYVDGGWGYGFADQRTNLLTDPTPVTAPAGVGVSLDQSERGWLGRFGGGCDYQLSGSLSSWVIGAFADYDVSDLKGFHTGEQLATIGLVSGQQKLRDSWAVGGRIGYLVTPHLMTYFDGGWTEARFSSVTYATGAGAPSGFGIPGQTYQGWFVGGGTEYALEFAWLPIYGLFWRNEYRFSEFQSLNVPVISTATGTQLTIGGIPNFEATKPYEQTITSSLVWRFNWTGR